MRTLNAKSWHFDAFTVNGHYLWLVGKAMGFKLLSRHVGAITLALLLLLVEISSAVLGSHLDEHAESGVEASSMTLSSDALVRSESFDLSNDLSQFPVQRNDNVMNDLQHKIRLAALNEALAWGSRKLQSVDVDPNNLNVTTPEEVCAGYNNLTIYNCSCRGMGREIEVNCTLVEPFCFTDNTTCYSLTTSQVLDEALKAYVITSCSTFTNGTAPGETCIRIFPMVNGAFDKLANCSATYAPWFPENATFAAPKVCRKCQLCNPPNTTNMAGVALDCCNVQVDVKQTCGRVDNISGVSIPFYDAVAPGKAGKCSNANVQASFSFMNVVLSFVLSIGLVQLLW
jgi:hypothetical protein